jgi:hypothetical protein
MAEIYFPAGVADDPIKGSVQWQPVSNGKFASTGSGSERGAPVNTGTAINMAADYPMSEHQFNGLFLPWWLGKKLDGGCEQGLAPFWMRDPIQRTSGVRKPYRWRAQQGDPMVPTHDGLSWIVRLSLQRLPT